MLKPGRGEQFPLFVQIPDDLRIRILDEFSPVRSLLRHIPLAVHKLHQGKPVLSAHIGVVLTEGRGNVHDAGTVGHCDIVVTCDIMGLFALADSFLSGTGEQRLVLFMLQIRALVSLKHFISGLSLFRQAAQNRVQQGLGHIIGIAVRGFHLHIGLLRVHTQGHIGGQGPGSGGPGQEISLLTHTFESCHRGAFLHRLVALGYLMTGQRGAAAGAVGHDLKTLVQKALVPDGF